MDVFVYEKILILIITHEYRLESSFQYYGYSPVYD